MSRISRGDFLRGDFQGARIPIRPPWAIEESAFVERCTRCDVCIEACPEGIVSRGRGGYPDVDFTRGECTFCAQCVAVCEPRALRAPREGATPDNAWPIKAAIQAHCLALNRVECRVCDEQCEARAIRFRLVAGAVATPDVDNAICNGCGACVAACPVGAVAMHSPHGFDNVAVPDAALG